MKRRVSIGLSLLLVLVMLSGCQSSSLAVPELIDRRESSEKTSMVEYRDIYDVKVEDTWVNGVRECVTAKTDGVVTELHKIVGDKVKKGEIILTTVSEEVNARYESLQQQISEARQNHTTQIKIYQLERKKKTAELSYLQSKANRNASGEADAKEQSRLVKLCQAEITEIDHNISYENSLYQAKSKVQQEQLSTIDKQRKQNVLKSPCNGIVGQFLNSVTIGSFLTAKQAVVVVYNTDCKVLNCNNMDVESDNDRSKMVATAQDITFYRLDKEYKLKEYVYTESQKRAGISMDASLLTCFTFDGIESLEIGDMGKIVYKTNRKNHVLSLPNDAIKSEGQQKFVYVNRGNEKEKTYIEIGVQSSQYTEIVSGLSEGDEVSYTAYEGMTANEILDLGRFEETEAAFMPKVSEVKVEKGDIDYSPTIELEEDYGDICIFEPYYKYQVVDSYDSGVFEKLLVSDGDKVKKGQVIAYVRHDVRKSELVSLQNEIAENQRQLTQERLQYDKQVKEYKKQMIKADTAYERSQINYDLEIVKAQYLLTVQSINQGIKRCQTELAQLQEKSTGVVRAPESGTVSESSVFIKGQSISQGDCLCTIIGTDCYVLKLYAWGDWHMNQKVTLTMEDGSKIPGTVIFEGGDVYQGGSEDLMMREEVKQACLQIFIKADKNIDYKLRVKKVESKCPQLKNVLYLPTGAMEGMAASFDELYYCDYYVNKKVGEQDYTRTSIIGAYCTGDREWVMEGLSERDTVAYLDYSDVDWEAGQ